MTRHIGIVACSAEGASLCYRTICEEGAQILGPHAHPEVSMHTLSLADYVERFDRDDWQGVGELMLLSARKLASIGADFFVCPDNTVHRGLAHIERVSPKPWLHIASVVAAHAAERKLHRIALLGTHWLVESDVYPMRLAPRGIECVRPDSDDRLEVHRIIMDELVYGDFKRESIESIQDIIKRMKARGCDAAALACTELPLVISDANSSLPTLDSTRLLARAALAQAVSA